MGQRSYPPLKPREVLAILRSLGFSFKRQDGSHAQYERAADGTRRRSVVTVDMAIREFGEAHQKHDQAVESHQGRILWRSRLGEDRTFFPSLVSSAAIHQD